MLRLGNHSFTLLLCINAIMVATFGTLLVATLVARHLVFSKRLYLWCALIGFVCWLAFLVAHGEVFHYVDSSPRQVMLLVMLLAPWLPYLLLTEVLAICWLGIRKT